MNGTRRTLQTGTSSRLDGQEARHPVLFAVASVAVGLSLFLPRPQNFAPIGALGLFAGAHARVRYAWAFPLGALALHTIAIGGYQWVVLFSVYFGFACSGLIGHHWLRDRVRPTRVGYAAVGTSASFFLISNLGSWIAYGMPGGETIAQHYAKGIPLFWNTLVGDLFFSGVLFGAFAVASARVVRITAREPML